MRKKEYIINREDGSQLGLIIPDQSGKYVFMVDFLHPLQAFDLNDILQIANTILRISNESNN